MPGEGLVSQRTLVLWSSSNKLWIGFGKMPMFHSPACTGRGLPEVAARTSLPSQRKSREMMLDSFAKGSAWVSRLVFVASQVRRISTGNQALPSSMASMSTPSVLVRVVKVALTRCPVAEQISATLLGGGSIIHRANTGSPLEDKGCP